MNKPNWYDKVSKKNKLHFDKRKGKAKASLCIKKDNVEKHKFFPFIHFQIKAFKYSKLKQLKASGSKYTKSELFKTRDINYSCYSDSYIIAYYNEKLSEVYELVVKNKSLNPPIAYRSIKTSSGRGKNNIDFAAEAFTEVKNKKNCFCAAIDIRGFFDNLDHDILKRQLISILESPNNKLEKNWYQLFKILTKFHYIDLKDILKALNKDKNDFWEKGYGFEILCTPDELRSLIDNKKVKIKHNKFMKLKKGIPQGTNISGLLANVYMLDFDIELEKMIAQYNGYYRRYSDDILVIVDDKYALNKILEYIERLLKKLNLEEAPEKRHISTFKDGIIVNDETYGKNILQYLGFTYDGKNIRVRNNTIGRFWKDAKPHIKQMIVTSLAQEKKIPKGKIYGLYSHLENRTKHIKKKIPKDQCTCNFYQYIRNAESKFKNEYFFKKEIKIKKQLKKSWMHLHEYIDKITKDFYNNPNKYEKIKMKYQYK